MMQPAKMLKREIKDLVRLLYVVLIGAFQPGCAHAGALRQRRFSLHFQVGNVLLQHDQDNGLEDNAYGGTK
jgi:hypothetical protein